MPEGDTVYRSARALDAALASQMIVRSDIRVPAFATLDLAGERVEEVLSRGKHLLMRLDNYSVHSHLKMEGSWHLYAPGSPWRRPAWQARIVLETRDHVAVGFQLGLLEVLARADDEAALAYLGPDILSPDWDEDDALARLRADPDRAVGLALLDQRVISGLGTVYRNELCSLRGVLPTRPVGEVPDLPGLVRLGRRMIVANRDRSERSTTGDLRRGRRTWVSHRERENCRRCGTAIVRGALGNSELDERDTYVCPHCQS